MCDAMKSREGRRCHKKTQFFRQQLVLRIHSLISTKQPQGCIAIFFDPRLTLESKHNKPEPSRHKEALVLAPVRSKITRRCCFLNHTQLQSKLKTRLAYFDSCSVPFCAFTPSSLTWVMVLPESYWHHWKISRKYSFDRSSLDSM